MEKIPTFKEYNDAVLKDLKETLPYLSTQKVEKYISSEESQEVITNHYEDAIEEYKNGEITYDKILGASVSATSNCLSLLYEEV